MTGSQSLTEMSIRNAIEHRYAGFQLVRTSGKNVVISRARSNRVNSHPGRDIIIRDRRQFDHRRGRVERHQWAPGVALKDRHKRIGDASLVAFSHEHEHAIGADLHVRLVRGAIERAHRLTIDHYDLGRRKGGHRADIIELGVDCICLFPGHKCPSAIRDNRWAALEIDSIVGGNVQSKPSVTEVIAIANLDILNTRHQHLQRVGEEPSIPTNVHIARVVNEICVEDQTWRRATGELDIAFDDILIVQ